MQKKNTKEVLKNIIKECLLEPEFRSILKEVVFELAAKSIVEGNQRKPVQAFGMQVLPDPHSHIMEDIKKKDMGPFYQPQKKTFDPLLDTKISSMSPSMIHQSVGNYVPQQQNEQYFSVEDMLNMPTIDPHALQAESIMRVERDHPMAEGINRQQFSDFNQIPEPKKFRNDF